MECVYFGTWNATRSGWCGGDGPGALLPRCWFDEDEATNSKHRSISFYFIVNLPCVEMVAVLVFWLSFILLLFPSAGPWIMADLESGLWACEEEASVNPSSPTMTGKYVSGLVKGQPGLWAVKAGNATDGPLLKTFEGPRPQG